MKRWDCLVRIQMLGPLRVWDGARWAAIGAPHHRIVLSVLLAEAGRPVPKDRLINDIWGERPTRSAASAVNGYVMRLRRLLRTGAAGDLVTRAAGYELVTAEDTVDVTVFERLLRAGKRCAAEGRTADAARNLCRCLALWRGPAFADVPSTLIVSAEAARLEQLRLAAWEEHLGAQLQLGQHAEIVDELAGLVRENPLRERLCRYLMIALYRCDRRAEALEAYRQVRAVLAEETGVEPGPELKDLERAVLTDDPVLAPRPARSVEPAQLPAAVADFTGRHAPLATLDRVCRQRPGAIVVVAGLAGVGKTALAVHWAHAVRDDFPDGQLHIDLRGFSTRPPVSPTAALAHFLQALGVDPEQIPAEADKAAGLYRSLTAGRRILVVLDNAGHPDHVRPLLPGGPGCMVLVTSRDQLRGLTAREGAVGLRLDVLPPDEAHQLLETLLPGTAVADAAELARLCGYLPLAIRIAAANLRASYLPVDEYNKRLAAGDRLDALGVTGDAMAATASAFDLSYHAQPAAARRLFRLLGAVPGDTVTVPAAAALAGLPVPEAEPLLDVLATAHLLEQSTAGRYRFHDLVRLYAQRLCLAEDAGRDAALGRLHDHYLSSMDTVARLLYPHVVRLPLPATVDRTLGATLDRPAEASRWVETERANMAAAIVAAGPAHRESAWRLTDYLRWHLDFAAPTIDWLPVTDAALAHARAGGSVLGQAAAQLSRATVLWGQSRYEEAIDGFAAARTGARDGGWPEGETCALSNLAAIHFEIGRLDLAAERNLEALEIDTRIGRVTGQMLRMINLGNIRVHQGRLDEAETHCRRVIELEGQVGEWHGQGQAHACLGEAQYLLERYDEALASLSRALVTHRRTGARGYEADTLRVLSSVHGALGRLTEAQALAAQALHIAREIGDHWIEAQALIARARTHALDGASGEARQGATSALVICRAYGYGLLEKGALALLG